MILRGRRSAGPSARPPTAEFRTSRRAVLYALDALTGRELWNSGNEIAGWNHYSGLTVANGRAYLTTFDGMIYAFGVTK